MGDDCSHHCRGRGGGRGGAGGSGEGERENGVKRARNDITFIHRFPRSPLIFRVQISLSYTLPWPWEIWVPHSPPLLPGPLTKRSLRDFGDVEVVKYR